MHPAPGAGHREAGRLELGKRQSAEDDLRARRGHPATRHGKTLTAAEAADAQPARSRTSAATANNARRTGAEEKPHNTREFAPA